MSWLSRHKMRMLLREEGIEMKREDIPGALYLSIEKHIATIVMVAILVIMVLVGMRMVKDWLGVMIQ